MMHLGYLILKLVWLRSPVFWELNKSLLLSIPDREFLYELPLVHESDLTF